MQANWSLVLNVLLLVGVFVAIGRMMKERRKNTHVILQQPSVGHAEKAAYDDIIAVRKVQREEVSEAPAILSVSQPETCPEISFETSPIIPAVSSQERLKPMLDCGRSSDDPVMIFLSAKENRQLAGYELLQTLLAAGLRFGEGQIFHRHQHPNGQGPVLCSLAAATSDGVFDLQNIGAFSVRGLCMFMQASGNPTIDAERFAIMLDTAKQLGEGLDAHVLDGQRRPLSDASLRRYYQQLNIHDECETPA